MDIIRKLQQVGIILDDNTFVAALKKVTATRMSPIEPLGVGGAEPLHSLFQIGSPGSDKKVVMRIHQHISEDVDIEPLRHLADSI